MIRGIYAVRDEASCLFMQPTSDLNNDIAMRNFDYAMRNNEMMKFKPSDFSLWYLGDFDDETGVVAGKNPVCVKRGVKK